ncbi:e9imm peptide [Streptomyces sp. NBC_00876]|uniref:e9imm peptide n=1 Tax=Streptomyces sp. NBC_00876 TaxID=2975853 RepID=UPI003868CFB6|nr:e9imm peptide [Streptomyces sp. NBC_00876]
MDREAAIELVQKIMNGGCSDEAEEQVLLEQLDRALGCPAGYVSGLIFWPKGLEPTAAEVVDQALAYQPFAL